MKKLFFFFLLFNSHLLFSQEDSDVLVQSNTTVPIPYAKVIFEGKHYYKNTDKNGKLKLENGEQISKVSATGYEDFFPKNNLKEYILIAKKPEDGKEYFPKNKKTTTIGRLDKKTSFYGGATDAASTQAQYLPYKKDYPEVAFVKKISFLSFFSSKVKKQPIILRIYKNNNGEPGELYGKMDIIVECKPGRSINKVDLSKSNIVLPKEGLFIGLEWINIPSNVWKYDYIKNLDGSIPKSKQYIFNLAIAYEPKREERGLWIQTSSGWKSPEIFSQISKINFEIVISD